MKARTSAPHASRGFTYFALLLGLALLGATLAFTGHSWRLAQQREMERELLFAGHEFRRALKSYAASGAVIGQFPTDLEDLLRDPRMPGVHRHLRRIYRDPMTGQSEWGLVRTADGAIVGVHSLSEAPPLKRAGFPPEDASFAGSTSYSQWRFMALPGAQQ
jgi:type II secretory pathway pseudopilin PulG